MHLFVGSTNPVKVNAVTIAASETWPESLVTGFEVPSGISEQPMSDDETRRGAVNRAKKALAKGLSQQAKPSKKNNSKGQFLGVGMEGGVFLRTDATDLVQPNELWSTVWAAVVDEQGNLFESNGARFKIPDQIAKPILAGQEMGPVVGALFGDMDAKKKNGAIGLLTSNFIDRTEEYTGIVKLALGLWFGKNWYDALSS